MSNNVKIRVKVNNVPLMPSVGASTAARNEAFSQLMQQMVRLPDIDGEAMDKFVMLAPYPEVSPLLPLAISCINELHNAAFVVMDMTTDNSRLYLVDSDLTCNRYPCGYDHLNDHYLGKILLTHVAMMHNALPSELQVGVISKIPYYGKLVTSQAYPVNCQFQHDGVTYLLGCHNGEAVIEIS